MKKFTKNSKEFSLGEEIITTKAFKDGIGKTGIIIDIKNIKTGIAYGIMFNEEIIEAHTLQGLLLSNKGFYLIPKEFNIVSNNKYKDKNKELYVKTLKVFTILDKTKIPEKINNLNHSINSMVNDIKSFSQRSIEYKKSIIQKQNSIKILTEEKSNDIDLSNIEKQYNIMIKHPQIDSVKIINNNLYIKTKDITYKKTEEVKAFDLGAYIIKIPFDANDGMRATNYKKHFDRGYAHPCIHTIGDICTGTILKNEINEYRNRGRYDLVLFTFLNFLEEPNYDGPYLRASVFKFAQPVSNSSDNLEDYFTTSFWSKQNWDDSKIPSNVHDDDDEEENEEENES